MNKVIGNLWTKIKGWGKSEWLIVGLIGLLLVVVQIPVDTKNQKQIGSQFSSIQKEENLKTQNMTENMEYRKQLEKELKDLLEGMYGLKQVEVMLTLKSDGQVEGVAIVVHGMKVKEKQLVIAEISEAVTALFPIDSHKVRVLIGE